MDISQLVAEFESITNTKVIFACKEIVRLGASYWPELVDDDLIFVSLAQDRKVLIQQVLDCSVKSYSFEIWFELSGWSQQPHLNKERIAMLMVDNVFVDPLFSDLITHLLKNKKITAKLPRRRPTYLRDQFDYGKIKSCLSDILFSAWLEHYPDIVPREMRQVIDSGKVPDDIMASIMLLTKGDIVSETDKQFIVNAILHYHTMNDGLWGLSGIDISVSEYCYIRDGLYREYKGHNSQ
jgi:hypothetical protein